MLLLSLHHDGDIALFDMMIIPQASMTTSPLTDPKPAQTECGRRILLDPFIRRIGKELELERRDRS